MTSPTTHLRVTVRRGRSQRRVAVFCHATVFDAADPASPLHGDIRGPLDGAVVITDGRCHMVALRSELTFS